MKALLLAAAWTGAIPCQPVSPITDVPTAALDAPASTSVQGGITDANEKPIENAEVRLVDWRGEVLARSISGKSGHFSVHSHAGQAAAVEVDVDGFVARWVSLADGQIESTGGDRYVALDIALERGHRVTLAVKDERGAPWSGVEVELLASNGHESWGPRIPPEAVAVTDEAGVAVFEDMPTSGLFIAQLLRNRTWPPVRFAVDLSEPAHEIVRGSSASLLVQLMPSCFEGLDPADSGRFSVMAWCEQSGVTASAPVGPDGSATLRNLSRGDHAILVLVDSRGASRWLGPRLAVDRSDAPVVIERAAGRVVTGGLVPWSEGGEPQLRWMLVDPEGNALSAERLAGLVPRVDSVRWSTDDSTGVLPTAIGTTWGTGDAMGGALSFPVSPPCMVRLGIGGQELDPVEVTSLKEPVAVPLDVDAFYGPRTTVTMRPEAGLQPGPGWTVECFRLSDSTRFVGLQAAHKPDLNRELRLPAGEFVWHAFSGPLHLSMGTLSVTANEPTAVDVDFPGIGAVRGRFTCDRPLFGLELQREDGATTALRRPALQRLGDGRFRACDLVAGRYSLVAKVETNDVATVVVVARGLEVQRDKITDLGRIEWSAKQLGERFLVRSAESSPTGVRLHSDAGFHCSASMAPGDRMELPSGDHFRLLLRAGPVGDRGNDGWMDLQMDALDKVAEF